MAGEREITLPADMPDSLQDLCVFYCINNLQVLVSSLSRLSSAGEGVSLSQTLGNLMLQYYTKFGIHSEDTQEFINQLLQNDQLCSELVVKRSGLLTEDNLTELSNNKLKCIELTYLDDDMSLLAAKKRLVMNSSEHLTKVCLCCRASQPLFPTQPVLVEDEDFDDWFVSEDIGDTVSNTKFYMQGPPTLTVKSDDAKVEPQNERTLRHLKSFQFQHVGSYEAGTYKRNSCIEVVQKQCEEILKYNTDLQRLSLSFLFSHPVKWIFSLPEMSSLKNLQYLTLSCITLGSGSDTEVHPSKDDFFTNLPLLKHLRYV